MGYTDYWCRMKMWRLRFGPCRHPTLYREVRDRVLHLVCADCAYARPVLVRSAAEQARQDRLVAALVASRPEIRS